MDWAEAYELGLVDQVGRTFSSLKEAVKLAGLKAIMKLRNFQRLELQPLQLQNYWMYEQIGFHLVGNFL